MSHELRTPFRYLSQILPDVLLAHGSASSFYGLLDILSGTELTPGQREIGKFIFLCVRPHFSQVDSANRQAIVRTSVKSMQCREVSDHCTHGSHIRLLTRSWITANWRLLVYTVSLAVN